MPPFKCRDYFHYWRNGSEAVAGREKSMSNSGKQPWHGKNLWESVRALGMQCGVVGMPHGEVGENEVNADALLRD